MPGLCASHNKSRNPDNSFSKNSKITPRALVRKQVENEDFHASDEDIVNLDTSVESIENENKKFTKQMNDDTIDRK